MSSHKEECAKLCIRECERCNYRTITIIDFEYKHKNCDGLMKLIGVEK